MKPLIAIIEWNFEGHRLSWFTFFCRACLDLGCKVLALCPDPEKVKQRLESFEHQYVANDNIRYAAVKTRFSPRYIPGKFHPKMQLFLFASEVQKVLAVAEAESGRKIDLFFLACILQNEEPLARRVINILRRPWSGLCLHARVTSAEERSKTARTFSMQSLFQDSNLVSLAIIDEGMKSTIENSLKKPVVLIPELTDDTFETSHPLEERFRRFANGSKLVLAIGHLRPNKGILNLAEVALNPASRDLAFAFVGDIPWGMFKPREREGIEHAITHAPSAIFHLNQLPNESDYNAVVRSCDVLFAAYHDFPHSSNTLSKAAVFRKPVIVSDGHLMANRVREFRMGEIVPQNNALATMKAIQRLTQDYLEWEAKTKPRWQEYAEKNSYNALVESFTNILAGLITTRTSVITI